MGIKKSKIVIFTILFAVILSPALVSAEKLNYEQILKSIDKLSSFKDTDFSAVMTMISEDPENGMDKKVVQQFRRDKDDKFLMLIEKPDVQKGQGYLRIGDNLWFYDPESRKFSHTSMKENFSNTDAKHSDFGRSSLAEDYTVTGHTEGKLGKYDVYILNLKAKNNEVTYPYMKIWITKKLYLVLKASDYSLTRRLLRTSYFPRYAKVGNRYTPSVMIFVDNLVKGKKTQISIKDISIDKLPDSVFTKSYVERVNR
ncbi:MAG: outer membrane lipoprotein-sorting protein [Spirochaetes bacterium]|nr:outer membrane lipoprotein-sorting protein [Spirochaetota bacterium]